MKTIALLFTLCIGLYGCDDQATGNDVFTQNTLLHRGVNIGNALEAPNEGDWGVIIKDSYFTLIKQAGFSSVRIPIRWSVHALADTPYTIDADFFSRVDWVISQARTQDLAVIINMHHYEEIFIDPEGQKDKLLSMWEQIANRYKNHSSNVFFEILNEPHGNLTPEIWNEFFIDVLHIIRRSNPQRTVLIGTAEWSGINSLNKLTIPAEESNVIVTVHYYNPFRFTHQGAKWMRDSDAWLGTTWSGMDSEKYAVTNEFSQIQQWGLSHNRPVNIGEFGAYNKADMASRILWTSFVSREAEKRNFSWNYWEFCSGFGIYDPVDQQWRTDLLKALIP